MKKTRTLTVMAMLTAVSVVLVYLIHFSIFPSAEFLEYDPADVPILIGAFALGPVAGIAITGMVALIQALTVSAKSGLYGFLMHLLGTSALVVPASVIYRRDHTKKGAVVGLAVGTAARCVIMVAANHFVTPYFMGVDTAIVDAMLVPVILPFNAIVCAINSVITFLLYKRVSHMIKGK